MSTNLLLVEWDVADWGLLNPMLDRGEMPTLNQLVEGGASGELASTQPLIPAALCTSLTTGKRPWQHGVCHGGELAQNGERVAPATIASRRAHSLLQMLEANGKRCLQIGWPATHAEQAYRSVIVSDAYPYPTAAPGTKPWPPAIAGTYWPQEIGNRLDGKRVSPEQILARVIEQYVSEWKAIDQKRDQRIGQLRLNLAADYSYQTAAIELLAKEPWDFAAIRFPALSALRQLFGADHLAQGRPDQEQTSSVYGNVIHRSYQILDNMLRQLVEVAGTNAAVIVVSGHGMQLRSGQQYRKPAGDDESGKSPHGIFVAYGEGFAKDVLVHGASILDVTPTILTWFGLPIGEDMEGRVLMEGFTKVPEIRRIQSWSSFPGISRLFPDQQQVGEADNSVATNWRRERDWNFVQSGMEAGCFEQVLPILNRLHREFPERLRIGNALFQCQLALKDLTGAAATLEVLLEQVPAGIMALLPQAELALAEHKLALARQLAHEIQRLNPTHPMILRKLGIMLLRLREWGALEKIARLALQMDERDAVAWLGLATAQLRLGQTKAAAESAARAISLRYFLPDAHFILARAFLGLGQWIEAKNTLETYMKLRPGNRAAAAYYSRMSRESGSRGESSDESDPA